MRQFLKVLSIVVLTILSSNANQATLEHSTAELIADSSKVKAGTPFWVALKLSLKAGWHTYWKNPGDTGMETRLNWTLPAGFSASSIQWLPPEKLVAGNLVSYGYNNEAYFLTEITPPAEIEGDSVLLSLKANWLVCEEACIPEEADLTLKLDVAKGADEPTPSSHKDLFNQLESELPEKLDRHGEYLVDGDNLKIFLPKGLYTDKSIKTLTFYPYDRNVVKYAAHQHWEIKEDHLVVTVERSHDTPDQIMGLLQINDSKDIKLLSANVSLKKVSTPPIKTSLIEGLLGIMVFAFLGGLILNAMPCVFPVLSLKAISVAKKATTQPHFVRQQGIFYTIGVVASFVFLALLLVGLKNAGQSIGWGFQMQNPYFIAFMIYLFFFIGLSLSGLFYLPILFGNAQAKTKDDSGKWGSFWVGILAVMVATPCTAPFMGVAIGYAVTQPTIVIVLVFISLALGFALPYLLISLFPPVLKLLPKPGAWMETFKEFMAFPMFASVAWLLWVLVQEAGTRGLILTMSGLVLMAFSIWLWNRSKSENRFVHALMFIFLAALTVLPLKFMHEPPQIIHVEKYSPERLRELRDQKKSVFVYATAGWCITCKLNEVTLKSTATQQLFDKLGIVVMEADWTNQDKEITDFLTNYGRSGVPLYVYYPKGAEGNVLPQLLTETIIVEAITNGGK